MDSPHYCGICGRADSSVGNPHDQMTRCTEFVTIFSSALGKPYDQMTRCTEFVLFLALHQVGFFRISRFIPDGICSNKAQSTRKITLFQVV